MAKKKKHLTRRILIWIRNTILFLFLFSILWVIAYKFVPVPYTSLMLIRQYENKKENKNFRINHQWVPIEQIAQHLAQAVIASEDNRFPDHHGFDLEQIRMAREEARKGTRVRGASTISQQTAKNVFLWPGKSYLRKGLEVWFTLLIELIWGKERIMEVYLNSIEMGNGLFGAEAVAQQHFGKHAAQLTKADAALIAATLPNPIRFSSSRPSTYILQRQEQIMSLMDKLLPVDMGFIPGKKNKQSSPK